MTFEIETIPGLFNVHVGQVDACPTNLPKFFSGLVNGPLPVGHKLDVSIGAFPERVSEPAVQGGISFHFRFGKVPGCGFNIVGPFKSCNGHLSHSMKESVKDERFDTGTRYGYGVGTSVRVLSKPGFASVVTSRLSVPCFRHRVFQGVSAARAAHKASEETGRRSGSCGCDSSDNVRGLECGPVDQWFVPFEIHDALPTMDFTEVGSVGDEVSECPDGPCAFELVTEPVGDRTPRFTGRSTVECFTDNGRVGPWGQPPVRFGVSEGNGPTHIGAAFHSVLTGHHPVFGVTVHFELRDGGKDRGNHSACVPGCVQSFRDGEEGRVMVTEDLNEFTEMNAGSSEPVEFRNNDSFGFTIGHSAHCVVESGPVSFLAGLVEVFPNGSDRSIVKSGPAFDGFSLFSGRDERFAFASGNSRNTHVSVDCSHAPLGYRALVSARGKGSNQFFSRQRRLLTLPAYIKGVVNA